MVIDSYLLKYKIITVWSEWLNYVFYNKTVMSSYETFKLEFLNQGTIAKVSISRPKVLNAMSNQFFLELKQIFSSLNSNENVRVIIFLAEGKIFTSGLDLREFASLFSFDL